MTSSGLRRGRTAALVALIAGLGLLLGGCGGAPAGAQKEIVLLDVGFPLREPHWINKKVFTIALRENEPQVVRFAASAGAPVRPLWVPRR